MDRRRAALRARSSLAVLGLAGATGAALEGVDPAPGVVRSAGSQAALPLGAQDFRGNPALQAFRDRTLEGGAGITRPMGLEGLVHQAAWLGWVGSPDGERTFAGRLGWRGFLAEDLYRDDAVFLGAAWRGRDVAAGVSGSALRCDFGEGIVGSAFGGSFGVAGRWRDLAAGASVSDASFLHAEPDWMREPLEAMAGVALAPRGQPWRSALSSRWREGAALDWSLSQEVALPAGADVGVGIGLEPFRLALGLGWVLGPVRLEAAAEGDRILGWQTHLALGFAWR